MLEANMAFSGFSVTDLGTAKQFYTQVLGLEAGDETMGLQLKLPGGGELFIYPKDDHQPATFTVLNFVVSDIDKAVDGLQKLGVSFERYDDLPGGQDEKGIARGRSAHQGPDIAWFKDPAGNILAVLQN
ncbi:MAG TPA: VOC family protein [Candidatus Saccharimonadales bacterium]|jgi:catechol 2,3-dioxygenase-like lactoylglutathione lyase family enzyme